MDLEKLSQNEDSSHKQPTGNKKKKKNQNKAVPLAFNDEESTAQAPEELAEQHRKTYAQPAQVKSRPDLRARIDELFDEYIKQDKELEKTQKSLDYYFNSYSHYGIHEEMLQDAHRTKSYELSMIRNTHLFKDKVVLDVGCGTGVLSMFAVRSGAKHVYAVENANIHIKAKEIIDLNGNEHKITVINGKIEEITLPVEKVDIIISEWMGYFLLYEGMLDSVIFARNKWLAKDGLMFPDRAIMYLKGIDDVHFWKEKLEFWNSVYGFDYSSIKKWIEVEPLVEVCPPNVIATESCAILDLNLQTCEPKDLDFENKYKIQASKDTYVNGLVVWFDTIFSHGERPIKLTTDPSFRATHWKQGIIYFSEDIALKKGESVEGTIMLKKNQKNPRDLDIKVSYHYDGAHGKVDNSQYYLFA